MNIIINPGSENTMTAEGLGNKRRGSEGLLHQPCSDFNLTSRDPMVLQIWFPRPYSLSTSHQPCITLSSTITSL